MSVNFSFRYWEALAWEIFKSSCLLKWRLSSWKARTCLRCCQEITKEYVVLLHKINILFLFTNYIFKHLIGFRVGILFYFALFERKRKFTFRIGRFFCVAWPTLFKGIKLCLAAKTFVTIMDIVKCISFSYLFLVKFSLNRMWRWTIKHIS
jgi:hypothetical protein